MIFTYIINSSVSSIDTNNISAYCDNNVWEFECDVALLDYPLKMADSDIYEMVMKNRKNILKDDKDILNTQKCWKPVVELFQSWEVLPVEEVILKGAEAINTIRIHRSL
jgi:hypothetical protein